MEILKPEVEDGNIEYKRFLINLDESRLEQLATQMKWRLAEGNNEAIYYLGVNDDGSLYQMSEQEKKETFNNFNLLVEKNKAEITSLNELKFNESTYFKVTIRKINPILPEIRVLLMGDSESGKTTFLANLLLGKTFSEKSDPRIYLMNHKHELESKKTSSINCNYIIFNEIKYAFMEAPGYFEYAKTKYKLLLSTHPDIVILFTNPDGKSNQFDSFICENLEIPILSVNVFDPNCKFHCSKLIKKSDLFNKISQLYKQQTYNSKNIKINILNVYPHNDLGTVVSGFLVSGQVKIGQNLIWTYRDAVTNCIVKTIHINSEPVNQITSNQMLTLCLKMNDSIKKIWKNGIISNNKFNQIKSQIKFQFIKFPDSLNLAGSVYGFCANKIVHVYNITSSDGYYTGTINNYGIDVNVVVIDFGQVKGIIKIIE